MRLRATQRDLPRHLLSGNKAEIKNVVKDRCKDFADYVRARSSGSVAHASAPAPPTPAAPVADDVVSQLERLAKLKEQGILSDEEFAAQKRKILG